MKSTPTSPALRELAQRLIASEGADKHAFGSVSAAFRVCDKLRPPLSTLSGTLGYRALIMRALTLARRESKSLESVKVGDDGSLQDIGTDVTPEGDALVEHLIVLLVSFVGEAITLRLLHDVWPELRGPNTPHGRAHDRQR